MVIGILTTCLIVSVLLNVFFLKIISEYSSKIQKLEFETFLGRMDSDLERREDPSYNETEADNKRILQ
jgi:hypothetical protein